MNFYEGTKIIFKKGKEKKKNSIRLKFRENWSEYFKKEKKKTILVKVKALYMTFYTLYCIAHKGYKQINRMK